MSLPNFYIEKPDFNKIDKSKIFEKLEQIGQENFKSLFEKANEPVYLYWNDVKYKQIPKELRPEEFWFLIKQFRSLSSKETDIKTTNGDTFKWMRLSYIDEFLHKIDISSGGQVFATSESISESNKQKFLSRGIIEEAIASSQLEGAHTTRQAAKKMLAEKREPRNKDEYMILNNYNTMIKLDEIYKNQELSIDLLFELHRMLTQNTIGKQDQGRFRKNSDNIVVQGTIGNREYITHIAPDEKFIETEIKKLIEYANDKNENGFLHPIIKAIFIHFWLGYLHPFVDGNGRLARTLFYWYLLRKNYWSFMYLPISTVIKRAPTQYAMAYIHSEQDQNDLTYFFDFHLRKIMQALNDFNNYVSIKISENKEIDMIVSKDVNLSERQKYLLHHLVSEENAYTTITSHSILNNISRQTSAKDIKKMVEIDLLEGIKDGKYIKYRPTHKLKLLSKNRI